MNHHLILTIDYELFGNGSGCLEHCVVEPTQTCLTILQDYEATLSFFVDATEFIALKQFSKYFENGLQKVENQLKRAADAGHSLQLHLHPQWIGAEFDGKNWHLDSKKWRIGDLDQRQIATCVADGIGYLKSLLLQHNDLTSPHCKVFRAGGWAIQPATAVLSTLQKFGVVMESTVAANAYNPSRGDWFDFRSSPLLPYWWVKDDVCKSVPETLASILEVPIATAYVGRVNHAKALKEHRSGPLFPNKCIGTYDGPNNRFQEWLGKASKLLRMGRVMLDFSTMPGWMLIDITQRHLSRFSSEYNTIPIVAIGHNKNFSQKSAENLVIWLDWVKQQSNITFSSYSRWHREMSR